MLDAVAKAHAEVNGDALWVLKTERTLPQKSISLAFISSPLIPV